MKIMEKGYVISILILIALVAFAVLQGFRLGLFSSQFLNQTSLNWKTFLWPAATTFLLFTFVFVLAQAKKDNSLFDIGWGLGFIVALITAFGMNGSFSVRTLLVLLLVSVWGLRLAIHIYLRNKGKSEDWRYKKWREEWSGKTFIKSFFNVFLMQWFLMQLIAASAVVIVSQKGVAFNLIDVLGISIWLFGFFFEVVGDWQLLQFMNNKEGVLKSGVWRYTRHPNYFGEVTLWWGIYLISFSVPWGFLTIISPLTITILLLLVSGIPLLEKRYEDNKEYQRYKEETSPFFPLPSKN